MHDFCYILLPRLLYLWSNFSTSLPDLNINKKLFVLLVIDSVNQSALDRLILRNLFLKYVVS